MYGAHFSVDNVMLLLFSCRHFNLEATFHFDWRRIALQNAVSLPTAGHPLEERELQNTNTDGQPTWAVVLLRYFDNFFSNDSFGGCSYNKSFLQGSLILSDETSLFFPFFQTKQKSKRQTKWKSLDQTKLLVIILRFSLMIRIQSRVKGGTV